MLLTFLYMIATIMQARRISFLNVHLNAVFKECKKRPSLTLRIKVPRHTSKDRDGYNNEKFLTSYLCTNKNRAKLDELLWYQDNAKMYTIYPQQKVDLCDWLAYPKNSSFPLYTSNNCCQISSKSDKLHVLVEVDLETYGSQASTNSAKLEDYGLIMAWTTSSRNMTFILETDLEHLTNLITGVMQGQYCINNGLFLTRVQSVLMSGKPCIYNDSGLLSPPPDKTGFYALCNAVRIASQQNKPKNITGECDIQSQDKDVNSEAFTEEFFAEAMKDAKSSNSAPTTCNSSPNEECIGIKDPYNLKSIPSDALYVVTGGGRKSDLTNIHLPDNLKKEDNTEESTNIDSKFTKETASKNSEEEKEKPSKIIKPPNVLICADSLGTTDSLQNLLLKVLERDRYVIHVLSKGDYDTYKMWVDEVSLVVLCGNVGAEFAAQLVEYVIQGGKLLALCSDMLHILLPSFKTAEVRENELVHFSYGKWKRVRMMHHIFCYHASPIRTRFSQDQEDTRTPALDPPTSINVKDKRGKLHSFDVEVLGREETWHSPSILLATLPSSSGKVVFSQIHLEIDPMQFVYEGDKFDVLKKSNVARLEIISDLLGTHLGLDTNRDTSHYLDTNPISVQYTPGYFLGKFEMKMKMLEKLNIDMKKNNTLKMSEMEIEFCANNEDAHLPSINFFPIMMHMCPPNFSTVDYFENLYTKELGRLVIYADVLTSSMKAIDTKLEHGLAVIARQQTHGRGRYNNKWLSPKGCAMFTLQVHISLMSSLSRCVSLLQHAIAVALVSAVRSIKGYEDIDLRIKWPNDIYVGNSIKIGGIYVSTLAADAGAMYVCNIGAGINLSNSKPTTCINDVILQYNQKNGTKLETFSYEKYFALVFNEMESLLDTLQSGNTEHFYKLYYKYWLHTNANVVVTRINGEQEKVKILGIDEYGYLLVQGTKGMFSVHSDGNSYDMFKGLIVPK